MPLSQISASELLDAMPDANVVVDGEGIVQYANRAFLQLLGYTREEVLRTPITRFLPDRAVFEACMTDVHNAGECLDHETYLLHKAGHTVLTVKNVRLLSGADGAPMVLATIRDLSAVDSKFRALSITQSQTERSMQQLSRTVSQKEQELFSARTQLEEILGAIDEIIWYIDDRTKEVRFVSRAVETVFGITQEHFLDAPGLWQEMVYDEDRERVETFFAGVTGIASHTIEFRIRRNDGKVRWLNNRITHHPDLNLFIGVTYDVTETKSAQDLIHFLAYHDPLTRLPNRVYLSERLEVYLQNGGDVALFFLDLDNFKYVNDTKGHEIGDALLVQITRRMFNALHPGAELIRFGGDEFIILLAGVSRPDVVEEACLRLLNAFSDAFSIGEEQFFLTASIGISLAPRHAETASDLIKHADTAMYAAKRSGKNKFLFYRAVMDDGVREFLRVEQKIREGIRGGYFRLYFQPVIDAATRRLKGLEALLRYRNPGGDILLPDQFIPVAERSGEIVQLSETVFIQASAFARELYDRCGVWIPVSINLSARQFHEQSLLSTLKRCIHTHDIPARALTLEITESAIMRDLEEVGRELKAMRDAGFKIALDDFGTGYSSLEYLARLPIDTLKIDKSFIRTLFDNPQNEHLVIAVITMARAMQMRVTAEGIETNRQADFLLLHGAHLLQGHLFSEPLPAEQILAAIDAGALYFTPDASDSITI